MSESDDLVSLVEQWQIGVRYPELAAPLDIWLC